MNNGRWARDGVSTANIERRNQESHNAAALLGMTPVFMGFKEGNAVPDDEMCRVLVTTLWTYQPHVVVTHPPRDYHVDHMVTSRCVEMAVHRCGNPTYETDGEIFSPPHLYFCDAWNLPFEPDVDIDVTPHLELKRKALACHRSQLGPDGPARGDMIDNGVVRARHCGFESGFEYAEAFRFVPRLGAVRTAALLT